MTFQIRWLGTACFQILLPSGQTMVLDPFLDEAIGSPIRSDQVEACDFILISHGHWDHVLDVGRLARRFNPRIFGNQATINALIRHQGLESAKLNVVTWGDVIREPGFSVEVLPGLHPDSRKEYERLSGRPYPDQELRTNPEAAKKEIYRVTQGDIILPERHGEWMQKYPPGEQLNFVIAMDAGPRIFVAGSYPNPEIIRAAEQARAFMTLLQVLSGGKLRGLEEPTVQLAMASGCRIMVPQHHDPIFQGARPTDLSTLKRILAEKSDIIFQELTPGQWYSFE